MHIRLISHWKELRLGRPMCCTRCFVFSFVSNSFFKLYTRMRHLFQIRVGLRRFGKLLYGYIDLSYGNLRLEGQAIRAVVWKRSKNQCLLLFFRVRGVRLINCSRASKIPKRSSRWVIEFGFCLCSGNGRCRRLCEWFSFRTTRFRQNTHDGNARHFRFWLFWLLSLLCAWGRKPYLFLTSARTRMRTYHLRALPVIFESCKIIGNSKVTSERASRL